MNPKLLSICQSLARVVLNQFFTERSTTLINKVDKVAEKIYYKILTESRFQVSINRMTEEVVQTALYSFWNHITITDQAFSGMKKHANYIYTINSLKKYLINNMKLTLKKG